MMEYAVVALAGYCVWLHLWQMRTQRHLRATMRMVDIHVRKIDLLKQGFRALLNHQKGLDDDD